MGTRKFPGAFRICTGCRGGEVGWAHRWEKSAASVAYRCASLPAAASPSRVGGAIKPEPAAGARPVLAANLGTARVSNSILLSYPPIVAQIAGHLVASTGRITRIAMVTPHAYPAPASLTSRAAHAGASSPRREFASRDGHAAPAM